MKSKFTSLAPRIWIATGLLAGSWLLGTDFLQQPNMVAWAVSVAVAVLLMVGLRVRLPHGVQAGIALALCLPAIWLLDFPYKLIPILLAAGLVSQFALGRWPRRLGQAAAFASAVLLVQALALQMYVQLTARGHELFGPLARIVGWMVGWLGIDNAVDGSQLVVHGGQQTYRVALIWELLFDPATVCFVAGGLLVVALSGRSRSGSRQDFRTSLRSGSRQDFRALAWLIGATLGWSLLRALLLVALIDQRFLRVDAISVVNVGELLVNGWLQFGLVVFLSLIVAILFSNPNTTARRTDRTIGLFSPPIPTSISRSFMAAGLVAIGIAGLAFFYQWQPIGDRKQGRILVVEKHSTWEPTTEPYSVHTYGEKGSYNYAALYDYCDQFYQMDQLLESDQIDDDTLGRCDVLIIKTPTARYTSEEVDAVVRFVRSGGSLLMIGDHTNVFNMNTYLNDVSRHFGFSFRNDLLFQVGDPYRQNYRPPRAAHPSVQYFPSLDFAVSCSIDPGNSFGSMAIRASGLYNLPPAYNESNYHPQAEYRTDMQYGSWCQLWATTYGSGRVLGFGDSTLFSNFCVYQPGKTQLALGMLEWLNHRSFWDVAWKRLALWAGGLLACVALIGLGVRVGFKHRTHAVLLMAAGLAGWSVGGEIVRTVHRAAMPMPTPQYYSLPHVVIDRTISEVPLSTGAFSDGPPELSYGLLEQWIPRLGCMTSREQGAEVTRGDAVIVVCPSHSVTDEYRQRLVEFVASGGHLFVVDSPETMGSTANSLLNPFGLESHPQPMLDEAQSQGDAEPEGETESQWGGELEWHGGQELPPIVLPRSLCSITGASPIASCDGVPVAAQIKYGAGMVTAIGFGSLFSDANMGQHWLVEPDEELLSRFAVLYELLELAFDLPLK